LGGDHQAGCCGFSCCVFDTRDCFLLRVPRSPLRGCRRFELRFFRPGRLPGGGHCGLRGRLRGLMRRGIRLCVVGWVRCSLEETPSSDDVIPPLAKVLLLGRWTGPLSFRSGRLRCGDAISAALGSLLCKCRLRLLPLHTATVVRSVVSPAATAHRLLPRGIASTGEAGAPTSDAPRCVSAVALRMAKALAVLALQRTFGGRYDSTDTRRPQSSVSDRTLDISDPRATDTMKWGVGGGPWRGRDCDGQIAAVGLPEHRFSGIPAPL